VKIIQVDPCASKQLSTIVMRRNENKRHSGALPGLTELVQNEVQIGIEVVACANAHPVECTPRRDRRHAWNETTAEPTAGIRMALGTERWTNDQRDAAIGSGVSYYVLLHGVAQHDAYHAGQIAMLKKGVPSS
jgi:hypothetical protein